MLVNGEIQYLSPVYQVNVTVTNPVTIVPFLRVVIQMDPGFIAYMHRFGLNAGAPNQRASDDPDHDGLSNLNEYLLSNTNRGWYYNPINSDTDGDGMDDLYETYSVDSTNLTEAGRATNRPAATDNGAGVPDNGPVGNPDGDYQWSTTDGYMQPGRPLMNIEEYIGPDGIAPYTMTQTVSFGDALYPFPANPVGYRPDVVIRVAVPADTGDQSKGNTAYTDRDVFDDGYEYSWDQWQQKYSGSNEVVIIGVTNGMADYLAFPLFLSRYNLVTNGVAIYITNTVPDWATSRVFNPGRTDIPENGPDYDVLYNYNDGKVSFFYYSAYLEYNAWQTNAFTVGISNAPHSIRMDFPPIMPNGMLPRRCSHPFLWDVDVDGLPDGWEVIFGFDPWTPSKFDRLHFPINVDAAGPNDPYPNDPEGSDPLEDGTLEHPFDSIQKAIDSVQGIPGMTVLVHDGTYTMRGNYGVSTRGTRIIVESENGSDFTHIDTLAAGPGFIFSSGETTNTVVRGFSIHTWAGYVDESGVILNGSSPMLEDLRIWDCGNYGIVCSNSAAPVINNFTVEDCNGGIRIIGSAPIISRGAVISNSAYRGGGLLIESGASPAIINCLIAGNVSETDGGGVSVSAGCAPSLINCTIADNVAATRGGGLASSGSPILRNIVLWANSASSNPGLYRASGTLDAQYSDLQGGWIGSNINTNPLFMDAGNYQLKFGSPCIDSGSGAGAPNNDLDWVARPSDGNFDGTNGFDMGCYEYNSGIAISGYDGLLDSWKYQCGIYPTNHVAELDLDHDGMTTWQEWLAGCNPMDSNSVFRFTKSESDPSGQGMIIRWPSISNRFYDLGRATNLLAGTNTFIILSGASNMPATPMENSYTDTVQGVGPYFYKINVHQ